VPFSLAILGERFSAAPAAFNRARNVLADHIVFDEYPPREEYISWLIRGDIVVSAALQENFGLSIIEAAIAGCWPLLPRRLAYPEVMPGWVSAACFWNDEKGFDEALEKVLRMSALQRNRLTKPLGRWLQKYGWENQARKLDDAVEETAHIKS
jgi:glycosyltransferase involved in cell wall biosynthesis